MKKTYKYIVAVLIAVMIIPALTFYVIADDNADVGDGTSGYAGNNMGWYSEGQYLWKVSLYVGKSDQVTKQSDLKNDFYWVGNDTVYLRPNNGATGYTTAYFAKYNKVEYIDGEALTFDSSPIIVAVDNCPKPPVIYDTGDIDTVKAFFGSTDTLNQILNILASDKGTTQYGLVQNLSFTIDGKTKTGWPSLPKVCSFLLTIKKSCDKI